MKFLLQGKLRLNFNLKYTNYAEIFVIPKILAVVERNLSGRNHREDKLHVVFFENVIHILIARRFLSNGKYLHGIEFISDERVKKHWSTSQPMGQEGSIKICQFQCKPFSIHYSHFH